MNIRHISFASFKISPFVTGTKTTVMAGTALIIMLAGCTQKNTLPHELADAQYWQRSEATSAIYQRGPKAQQMLNRDISRCVVEIRELERLGAIRHAIPGDAGDDSRTPEGRLADWESPERDGMMRSEHLDYHDFESCMVYKGWERVAHVPYQVADEARSVYSKTILGEEYHKAGAPKPALKADMPDDYEALNE